MINHKSTAFVLLIFDIPLASVALPTLYQWQKKLLDIHVSSLVPSKFEDTNSARVSDYVGVGVVVGHHVRAAPLQLLTAKLLTVPLSMLLMLLLHSLYLVIFTAAYLHDGL